MGFVRLIIILKFMLVVNCVDSDTFRGIRLLLKEINKPLRISAIVCWRVDESVDFIRKFSNLNYQISVVSDEIFEFSNIEHSHYDMFIVDIRCSNLGKIVNQTNYMDIPVIQLFRDCSVLVNSEIYLITKSKNDFVFQQIYKTSKNQPILIENFALNSLKDAHDLTPINRRRNLGGIELRASMVVTENATLNHLDDYIDKHIDTITKVCFILTNHLISYLNATVTYSIVPSWGYLDTNGTWSGMIGQLVRNEADLGATSLFFTADRVGVIQYIAMPSSTGSAFIFRSPKLSYTNNVFVLPFDDFVWLCLGCLVLITAGSLMAAIVLEWKIPLGGTFNETESGFLRPKVSDVLLLIFGATCQQGSAVAPKSYSARIITITAFIILMFLYTSYAANIVALLQSPSTKIKTLKDLSDSRLRFGVDDTIFNHYYFSHATEPTRKKIYEQKVRNKDGTANFMNLKTGIENVRKGLFAFHMESGVGYKVISETFYEDEKCGLKEIKYLEVIDPWYAIQKNSSYMELFKSGLMRINEHGLQDRENSRLYTRKPKCSGGGHFVTASLVDTGPAMLVLVYGHAIATIFFFMEILVKRLTQRNKHI